VTEVACCCTGSCNGTNRILVSTTFVLRAGTDPISEKRFFFSEYTASLTETSSIKANSVQEIFHYRGCFFSKTWFLYDLTIILSRIWGCDYRWGINWILNLLIACIHHSELHFTEHWHTQTSVLSPLNYPQAVSWQRFLPRENLQIPALRSSCHSRPCSTLVNWHSTNWVPGWRQFHTHTSYSSLTRLTFNWTELELNTLTHEPATVSWTIDNSNYWLLWNSTDLAYNTSAELYRKHRLHC
jgi:hypothetical protein